MLPMIVGGSSAGPLATDDSYQTAENTPLVVDAANGVLANDSGTGISALQAVLESDTSSGALSLNADGSFGYTPDLDFSGQDSFTYHAHDGSAASNIATVTLTVNGVNDAPAATDDSYQTAENTPLVVGAANGVLANDSDAEMDALQAVLESDVSNGVLNLNADGSFDYTPNADFTGQDSFEYLAYDGSGISNIATVTLTISTVNNDPVAVNDSYQTAENIPLVMDAANGVLTNDSDVELAALQAILESDAANGVLNLNVDGSFDYTPNAGFSGQDSFEYRASDGSAVSNIATVTLTVNSVNEAPMATGDSYQTAENTPLVTDVANGVLANDSDTEMGALQAVLESGPSNGVLNLSADGSFDYTPNADFIGQDSFTYHAFDGLTASNTATVTVTVDAVMWEMTRRSSSPVRMISRSRSLPTKSIRRTQSWSQTWMETPTSIL